MLSLLNELKRRNVFRVGMSYAIVAWVLVQAGVAIVPVFEAPPWVLKILFLFIVAGFPLVLVLAWAYELTPEGIRRTPDGAGAGHSNARVFDAALVVALIAALGISMLGQTPWHASGAAAAGAAAAADGEAAERTSLAIMPFSTLNTDAGAANLARGMSETIHGTLYGARGLSLTGMASSVKVAQEQRGRGAIAEELGVRYLVEGSVRINNSHMTVFAQLVELPDRSPVWSGQFRRRDAGLDAIRHEIASGIAGHLGIPLPDADAGYDLPSAAYEDWLQVLGNLRRGGERQPATTRSIAERLVDRAPGFGPAHAALAYTLAAGSGTPDSMDFRQRVTAVEALLDEAMALAPRSPRVQLWRAASESRLLRWRGSDTDFRRINQNFDKALDISRQAPDLLTAYAEHKLAWGETRDAIALVQRAIKSDPLSIEAQRIKIEALIRSGKREAAEAEIRSLSDTDADAVELRERLAAALDNLRDALDSSREAADAAADLHAEAVRVWSTIGDVVHAAKVAKPLPSPEREIWQLARERRYAQAYELASSELQATEPGNVLLLGLLAVQTGKHETGIDLFARYFADWLRDLGPLRGLAAMRYAPWYAKALMETGREEDARRLLDRHLAGLIAIEDGLAAAESGLYFAANFATLNRADDAQKALERAIDDGFRLSRGVLGDPAKAAAGALMSGLGTRPADPRRP